MRKISTDLSVKVCTDETNEVKSRSEKSMGIKLLQIGRQLPCSYETRYLSFYPTKNATTSNDAFSASSVLQRAPSSLCNPRARYSFDTIPFHFEPSRRIAKFSLGIWQSFVLLTQDHVAVGLKCVV